METLLQRSEHVYRYGWIFALTKVQVKLIFESILRQFLHNLLKNYSFTCTLFIKITAVIQNAHKRW